MGQNPAETIQQGVLAWVEMQKKLTEQANRTMLNSGFRNES